jgi:hypothetical protein
LGKESRGRLRSLCSLILGAAAERKRNASQEEESNTLHSRTVQIVDGRIVLLTVIDEETV